MLREDIKGRFPNVSCYIVYSRNHMKWKGEKTPKPKFHVYFPVKVYTDRGGYENLKNMVCKYFPEFDQNAKDSARFFFGVENPTVDFFDGGLLLSDFMETVHIGEEATFDKIRSESGIITEGTRHSTLISVAVRNLKRWGDTEQATRLFEAESEKCYPQLSEDELSSIWSDARKFFHQEIENSPDYLSPELYGRLSKKTALKAGDFADLGQTDVFVKLYEDIICYSSATGYLVYDKVVWRESKTKVRRLAQLLTDAQLEEASRLKGKARKEAGDLLAEDEKLNKSRAEQIIKRAEDYYKFIIKCRHTSRISAVMTEAMSMVEINVEILDRNGELLNTPAGIVNLKTGELKKHSPLDYCTKITRVGPNSENMELFYKFLETITCDDEELENYLQLVSGMCLIGKVYCENLIIAFGSGNNGKSTFFNLLSMVMGDYAGTVSPEVLIKHSQANKKNEYAELRGKRLILAAELKDGCQLDSAAMKHLCSTDQIHAEKKFEQPFSFIPSHTTILYTNHLPSVDALDNGTWKRLVIIPFNAVIQEDVDVKNYAEYLFQHCGGAVLSWMIDGAKKFIAANHKISQPKIVKQAIEDYRNDNNWIQSFLSDCCEINSVFTEKAGPLYDCFKNYCDRTGKPRESCSAFKKAMVVAGFNHKANAKGSFYYGVRLKTLQIPYVSPPMVKDGSEIEKIPDFDIEF